MEKRRARWTIVACLALVLIAIPVLGYGQSAEEWLSMGRNETDPQTQIDYFTRAIRLNPELAEAYTCRGTAYSDLGKYDQAVLDYTRAAALNPDNAQTYNNRGYAYEKLGQYEKAVADFTRAIRIEPHYSSAYNNRGVSYYKLGMIDKALADFDKACKLGYGKGCENYYTIKQ
jgi:tetratricopeptide (TPR) repeat protein